MSQNEVDCPICGQKIICTPDLARLTAVYECPHCGKFETTYPLAGCSFDRNHLESYLFYHNLEIGTESIKPMHIDPTSVEAWYPHSLSERIDHVLLYFGNHIHHIGQKRAFNYYDLLEIAFIDRYSKHEDCIDILDLQWGIRDDDECTEELLYILNYLESCKMIKFDFVGNENDFVDLQIAPGGYARIDELQKNTSNGRDVLVAMKFGDDTKTLRESIRMGIAAAGYHAVLIDEVDHNDFITPELLKHIRDSKFVVVDLTHQNNGAYFEEGYAMGLGKPVIQLCKKDTHLHFDIAQKNTIIWASEVEIPERLCNRIKAAIE